MKRTGTVVSIEKVGVQTSFVIEGLPDVREGQHLRNGDRIWTIVKKHWFRKPRVSVILNRVSGSTESLKKNDILELILDKGDGTDTPIIFQDWKKPAAQEPAKSPLSSVELMVETVVRFEKRNAVLCVRGTMIVGVGDILTDGTQSWKITSITDGLPTVSDIKWFIVKSSDGVDPAPGTKLTLHNG